MNQKNIVDALDMPNLGKDLALMDEIMLQAVKPGLSDFLKDRLWQGKRLRPTLLILAAGGRADSKTLKAAAAVELIHQASKLHDDVLDETIAEPAKYLLGGDLLISDGLSLAASQEAWIAESLSAAIAKMIAGEFKQSKLDSNGKPVDDTYQDVCLLKTASLFMAAADIGAQLGGRDKKSQAGLNGFGRLFGLAYQMNDDLTDGYFTKERIPAAKAAAARHLKAAIETLDGLPEADITLKRFASAALPGLS